MAKSHEGYRPLVVESYRESGSSLHGDVHIRPLPGQWAAPHLRVECSKRLSDLKRYKFVTPFRIRAKLTIANAAVSSSTRISDGERR
jgi:hypothetical protein